MELFMNRTEYYNTLEKLGNIVAYVNILYDYMEFNLSSQEMGYARCLIHQIIHDSETLYDELDKLAFDIFDFDLKNLK